MGALSHLVGVSTVLSVVIFLGGLVHRANGSEAPQATGLDGYLARMGYEKVSFTQNERNQPLLAGEIKGRRHMFLADTGCRNTILTPAAATGLKTLGQLGVTLEDHALGQITNSSVVLIDRLVIGAGQFLNQPAWVEPLQFDYIRPQFDSILGLDFFFRNFCLVDCYRRAVFLRAARPSPEQSMALQESLRRSGFIGVPLQFARFLTVDAIVEQEPVGLLVDTGDSFSVLDESLAKRLQLSSIKWDLPAEGSLIHQDISGNLIGFGQIGSHKVWVTRLGSFQVGAKSWSNVPYGVANLNDWGLSKPSGPGKDVQGLFGNDWLHLRGALIDFSSLKLWFRPDKERR